MSFDEQSGKYCLGVLSSENGDNSHSMLQDNNVYFDEPRAVELRAEVKPRCLQFYYRFSGDADWMPIGPVYDSSTLSDDFAFGSDFEFTGAFVGLCCQDSMYGGHPADFDWFRYTEH